MRAFDHLDAAILSTRAIDGYQTTRHVWEKTLVRIPVTVVLVPFPRAAHERLLQHHLVVIMIDLSAEQLFQRFDDTQATHECAVYVVFKNIREPQLARAGMGIATLQRF